MTAPQHRTTGIGVFIASALYNGLALAWYDAQVTRHRVARFRPVCAVLGHTFDVTLTDCVRCDTTYNRVRDCRRMP